MLGCVFVFVCLCACVRLCEPVAGVVPVDHVPHGLEVVRAHVLVLEVVCVLPHVDAENGNQTCAFFFAEEQTDEGGVERTN